MALGVEPASARDFDHVTAPQTFGAIELYEGASAAEPLPRFERQLLHALHADAAINRHAFIFHEIIVGRVGPVPAADAGILSFVRLLPLGWVRGVLRHEILLVCADVTISFGAVGAEVQMTTRIPVSPKVREKIFSYAEIDLQGRARDKRAISDYYSAPLD